MNKKTKVEKCVEAERKYLALMWDLNVVVQKWFHKIFEPQQKKYNDVTYSQIENIDKHGVYLKYKGHRKLEGYDIFQDDFVTVSADELEEFV